jgi:hypothetical protein
VLAHRRLGCRGVDGVRQLGGIGQALGQLHTAHRAGLLVLLPAAAREVAAHHGLHWNGLEALHEHGASLHLRHFGGRDHALGHLARQVVGHDVAQLVEPEQRHAGEQLALAGDRLAHDHVEGRQAVAGHHEDAVLAHGVVVAHLATRQQRQGGQGGGVQGGRAGLGHGGRTEGAR